MKVCILENDILDPVAVRIYQGYGAMFERLLRQAGFEGEMDIFNTVNGEYPVTYEDYEAVLLTGSKFDSFSQEPWVLALKAQVQALLQSKKKLIGVCFGHQLIALCLGAKVGRAPQGWGAGRMQYEWTAPDLPQADGRTEVSLLASHQDQVFELPSGAKLLATSTFCPVAAYGVDDHVFCVQPHPEFVEDYSAYILNKRRDYFGEEKYQAYSQSLSHGHDGLAVAHMMVAFIKGQ
jgi:GMP synthase-like glutamine amidotransferase